MSEKYKKLTVPGAENIKPMPILKGAVIGAGCVITRSVPPGIYMASPVARPAARARVPLSTARSMEEFWAGLTPMGSGPVLDEEKDAPTAAPKPPSSIS